MRALKNLVTVEGMEESLSYSFLKMQALGNDFVLFPNAPTFSPETLRQIAHRKWGIGCDQVLILHPPLEPDSCDALLDIWNADGTQAEACGNGTRGVISYLWEKTHPSRPLRLQTLQGVLRGKRCSDGQIQVEQGTPAFLLGKNTLDLRELGLPPGIPVNMGNPHLVIFVSSFDSLDINSLGEQLEKHPFFPNRTNVIFATVVSSTQLALRIWERGAGHTLACGSGACAAVAAAIHHQKISPPKVQVILEGGSLEITYHPGGPILQKGPVQVVYKGVWLGND